jgi:metallo-beta-lactamase class B
MNIKANNKIKIVLKNLLLVLFSFILFTAHAQKRASFAAKEVYKSDDLIITQVYKNAFEHTSFKQTKEWGKVPCNGLLVRNANETIIFDTPTNNKASEELIRWINETLKSKINAVIPTHFHDDSIGGLQAFEDRNIPSYAYLRTVELAKENNYTIPRNSFTDSLILKVGKEIIIAKFFGEGHTKDNAVCYFPSEDVLFGGCLIKELDASKGYLVDSNISEWSKTVEKVKKESPKVKTVIPGHGDRGDGKLLDYTIELFRN